MQKQKNTNTSLQSEIDNLLGTPSAAGSRTRDASGRSTPSLDSEVQRRFNTLQSQHTTLQAELAAAKDVLAARERELEMMRRRVEDAEREVENLREDLQQAQQRISTLLEMGGPNNEFGMGSGDSQDDLARASEDGSSEEASMAFDKVCQTPSF